MAETSQGKLRTNLEAVAKSKHLALLTQDRNFSETELRAAVQPATRWMHHLSSYEVRNSHNVPGLFDEM